MFTLAHIFFKSATAPEGLLYMCAAGAASEASESSIHLATGATLSLDSYFNSFYERYWFRHTPLRNLAFTVNVSGPARLNLVRVNGFGDEVVVATVLTDGGAVELAATPPHFTDAETGRLFVTIDALSGPITVSDGRWVTADAPLRDAQFDLVTPTAFNREEFLGPSVQRLVESPALKAVLSRCLLINQSGTKLQSHPAFSFLSNPELAARVEIIDQGNYGSTGGYTRGVVEMFGSEQATHALFMDDDAQVEPEAVYRAYAFARFVKDPCIIGGHMFDLIRPHMLYEATNTTRLQSLTVYNPLLKENPDGVDARARSVRDMFIEARQSHYNAWWLCAIPRIVFERVGMPLPFFVRGDDVSLGLRAREQGIPTISLPGMAIWHEPFSMKPGGFKEYYIVRNMLINATLHAPVSALGFLPVLWARFMMHLLRFDYALAALTQRGLADFMKGPSQLSFDGASFNQDIISTMKAWSSAKPMPAWIAPTREAGVRPSSNPIVLAGLCARILYNMCMPNAAADRDVQKHILDAAVDLNNRWEVSARITADTLVASNPYVPQSFLHARDFWKFWTLMGRMLATSLRLLLQYGALRSKWLRSVKDLSTMSFWQSYLKLGHKSTSAEGQGETRPKAA